MTQRLPALVLLLFAGLAQSGSAWAEVRLAKVFTDHMVLQQGLPIAVFGWADPAEKVTVTFNGKTASATAASDGRWRTTLPAMKADGRPQTLIVKGKNTREFADVLLGEVWLCCGQSNMSRGLRYVKARVAKEPMDFPDYRLLHVELKPVPQRDDLAGVKGWAPATRESMTTLFVHPQAGPYEFSEVGYEFGKRLHEQLKVPVGIIAAAFPGSTAKEWTPPEHPETTFDFEKHLECRGPGALYQSMIVGLPPFSIRGVVWYQGENDAKNLNYADDLSALTAAWHARFGRPDMPFYMAQIAQTTFMGGMLHVWEAQAAFAGRDAYAALAPSNDLWDGGNPARIRKDAKTGFPIVAGGDPHPPNKHVIARRLADIALAKTYGKLDREVLGPMYESHEVRGGKILVKFQHAGSGLKTDDSKAPDWFEISNRTDDGSTLVFVPAQAKIIAKDTVEVWADKVAAPGGVRFAWHPLARHNLYNSAGLPAIPFHTVNPETKPSIRTSYQVGGDFYDPAGQQKRARDFREEFTKARVELFDKQGRWHGAAIDKPIRGLELSAYLVPFLQSGNPKLLAAANAIYEQADEFWKGCFSADSYMPLPDIFALMRCRSHLTPAAAARMEQIARLQCEHRFLDARWEFQGDNDNFPLTANAALAAWGVYAKKPELIELARHRFEQFKALLSRRGFASEYNSPAYTFVQLNGLAVAVELVDEPRFRQLSLELETRLWLDLLSHYHPPSGTQGGPWSREYNFDIYGVPIATQGIYLVLGGKPLNTWPSGFATDTTEWGLARAANHATVPYHCPAWLAKWALDRKYPFSVVGTAEGGASYSWLKPERGGNLFHWMSKDTAAKDPNTYVLPAWTTRLVNYQTEHYSLGTASRMFNDGSQNDSFVVTVALASPMQSLADVTRVFARYTVDDSVPGVTLFDDFMKHVRKQTSFPEAGRTIALQHDRTAMVLYRSAPVEGYKPRRLRTMILIPNREFGAGRPCCDQAFIGREEVRGFRGESRPPEPVFLRIYKTYLAFLPLINNGAVGQPLSRQAAVRIQPEGNSLCVSFYNYEGEPLAMNPRQYCMLGNGFICEMGSADDGDFAGFRKRFAAGACTVSDNYRRTVHSRGVFTRRVSYRRPGLTLETEYEPVTEGIRYQTINGKPPSEPQLEATGLPREKVPFLDP
jgi:hypothetical protein